ncbi:hypothetical protein [Curtobacterium sp. Leaf261]|uniref:hypothetical protein n=1 Tax=Curtobacterium sp. Leaf261 TaxID=1736311 RepID=UPI0006FC6A9A|nr:hypothetical protein [Curtobacterium sp. Leaf261]KQO63694.1 hypothetical protein ASF23_05600 [Curtobacterium sp. Leaf261]
MTDAHDGPDAAHRVPEGVDDATVEALGKLSEGLEVVEHARGLLYGFHRLTGMADLTIGESVELFRKAGRDDVADRIERDVVGRNAIAGRWSFQIVEDYDDGYYDTLRAAEREAREQLAAGRRHLFEAGMKEDRRTHGLAHHEATPADVGEDVPPRDA